MQLPIVWELDLVTVVSHNDSQIGFYSNGDILLEGSIKEAALAFVKNVVDRECVEGTIRVEINKCVCINCERNFALSYIGAGEEPEFWDEFVQEYNRIIQMRVFW